jgi:hypothetical protein
LGAEELKDNAEKQLGLLRERKAMQEFSDAVMLYEKGFYGNALDALLKFEESYPDSDMISEAQKVIRLCRKRLESASQWRPYQAEVLYQQAERKFFGGDSGAALRLLEDLETKYSDTPAGVRAKKWKEDIVRRLEMAKLEGSKEPELDMNKVRMSYSAENIEDEISKILEATKQ